MRLWYAMDIIVYRLYRNMQVEKCFKDVKCIATSTDALTRLKVFNSLFQKLRGNKFLNKKLLFGL